MSKRIGILIFAPVFVGALFWASESVRADTVVLRNGRKFTNVKTRLTKGRIIITDKRGRVRRYRARDIKLMLPGKVNWTKPARKPPRKRPVRRRRPRKVAPVRKVVKKEPVRPAPVRKVPVKTQPVKKEPVKTEPAKTEPTRLAGNNPVLPRSANGSEYSSNWSRAGQSLIPFWSGFYNGGRNNLGYLFTGLEIYALAALIPWIPPGEPYEQEILPQIAQAGRPPPPPGPGGGPPPPGDPPGNRTAEFYGQIGALGLAVHPRTGGIIRRADLDARRNQLTGGLVAVVITHVVLAYFIEPPVSPSPGTTIGGVAREPAGGLIFSLNPGYGNFRSSNVNGDGRAFKLGYSLRF